MGLPRPDAGTPVHDYLAQHWSRMVILNWPCLVRHMTGPSLAPDAPAMACWPARGDDKRPCRPNSPVGPYNSRHPDECVAGGRMYSVGRAAVLLLPAAVLVEVQGGSDDR
jgi:hypothetical protein